MEKIPRVFQKIFGSNASDNGQFGSAEAGTKVLSTDLATLMALPAYLAGWTGATVSGDNLPTLEEMQTLDYINTTQLAYLFQEGIPEYDSSTTYFTYSIVKKAATYQIYGSLADDNTGNALTDGTKWVLLQDLSDTIIPANQKSINAAGTVYSLTNTAAAVTFGTTSPAITLDLAGTYMIEADCILNYNGATFSANQNATMKLRRTNNTAADLTGGSRVAKTDIVTAASGTLACMPISAIYTATAGDAIALFGSLDTVPGAGSLDVVSANMRAFRLQQ